MKKSTLKSHEKHMKTHLEAVPLPIPRAGSDLDLPNDVLLATCNKRFTEIHEE